MHLGGSQTLIHRRAVARMMAFEHNGYTLHAREIHLKNGTRQVIYFFSKRSPKSGIPVEMPQGYAVAANKRTGLPYLKKTAS